MGDWGSIPGLGRSPGEGKGYPFQYSGLENSMDSVSHGVAKNRTQLSDFHFQAKLKTLSHLCVCNLAMRTKATGKYISIAVISETYGKVFYLRENNFR